MQTFYDRWLNLWDEAESERAAARKVIHFDELEWVETPQDAKIALVVSPETGFRTWGTSTMWAEIPVGWHTGQHSHGEEVIYILAGKGCTVVNGNRYKWGKGSVIAIPFGSVHQHFNTGDIPVEYFAVLSVHLEHFVGLHRTLQHEYAGQTTIAPSAPLRDDGFDPDGKRVVLLWEESIFEEGKQPNVELAGLLTNGPARLEHGSMDNGILSDGYVHHKHRRKFMSLRKPMLGFQNKELEISTIMGDGPHSHGGKHAHMEAIIHILSGTGYSIVGEDDDRVDWRAGSTLHVVGPQTAHQHFNESDETSQLLRIAPGIRYFFEEFALDTFPYLYYKTGGIEESTVSKGG